VTSLLPPGNVTTTGLAIGDAQRGLLPTVCLVGSLLTIVGLLLSFPYGSREKLVVDFAGNVRGINEPALPPPAAAQHSAQGLAMMGSDGLPALALPGPRSSDVRARVALVSVGLTMAATGLVGAGMVFGIDLANRFDSVSRSDINQWRRLVDSMTGFYVAAYVVSVPTFLAWLSRVVDNVPALGGGKPSVSSAGAIGWWFVPIVNLFKPCLIVADVWRRLATRPREAGAGPVLAWWVLWLGGLLVMQLVAAVPEPTADAWRRVLIVQSAALVAQVVAGGLLLWIIRGIERRSETRMAALAQPIAQQAYWGPPTIAATPVVAPTGAPVAGLLPGPPPPGPRTVGPPAPVGPPVSPLPLTTVAAFCAQCGTPRTTDARFCVGCGARFELPVHA